MPVSSRDLPVLVLPEPLRVLTPEQICQIDRCLAELADFGQLTLVKRKGRLRFIEKTESVEVSGAGTV